jgi:hypothetical protein
MQKILTLRRNADAISGKSVANLWPLRKDWRNSVQPGE